MKNRDSSTTVTLRQLVQLRHYSGQIQLLKHHQGLNHRAGGARSNSLGRGMSFSEVRHYLPGDDIKSIDWKVTARTNQVHTKLFEQEKEREVFFCIDFGPNMYFATRGELKSVLAAKITALLAFQAAAQGDSIGGLIHTGEQHFSFKPHRKDKAILHILSQLAQCSEQKPKVGTNSLMLALQRTDQFAAKHATVVLLSDFYALDEACLSMIRKMGLHRSIIAIKVYDLLEKRLPENTQLTFSRQQDILTLNTSQKNLTTQYCAYFQQTESILQQIIRRVGGQLLSIATTDSPTSALNTAGELAHD